MAGRWLAAWARRAVLAAIRGYQRWISPYKGFACAWRVHTGGPSCSALAARAYRRWGLRKGWGVMRRRQARCGDAYRRYHPVCRPGPVLQGGFCDLGCDAPGCDLPSCDLPSCDLPSCDLPCQGGGGAWRAVDGCCDAASCCDCDWPRRKDRRRGRDAPLAYVPPYRPRRGKADDGVGRGLSPPPPR